MGVMGQQRIKLQDVIEIIWYHSLLSNYTNTLTPLHGRTSELFYKEVHLCTLCAVYILRQITTEKSQKPMRPNAYTIGTNADSEATGRMNMTYNCISF